MFYIRVDQSNEWYTPVMIKHRWEPVWLSLAVKLSSKGGNQKSKVSSPVKISNKKLYKLRAVLKILIYDQLWCQMMKIEINAKVVTF